MMRLLARLVLATYALIAARPLDLRTTEFGLAGAQEIYATMEAEDPITHD